LKSTTEKVPLILCNKSDQNVFGLSWQGKFISTQIRILLTYSPLTVQVKIWNFPTLWNIFEEICWIE
jgi:hypothetical protein